MPARALAFDPIDEARRQWSARWPAAALPMAAATSIMRAQQLVLAAVDRALAPYGLSFARFELLTLLRFSRSGALPTGKLGPRLMVHPTTVTSTVDRLEADGLVVRRPHERDRRVTLVEITGTGRTLLEEATVAVNAQRFGLSGVDDASLEALVTSVRALRLANGEPVG